MGKRRSRIITIAVFLGILGAALPIIAASYLAWYIAVQRVQKRLEQVAGLTIMRATGTFADAKAALDKVVATPLAPCSDAHVALMRTLTVDTPSVEEIGYFEKGLLKCTSWGRTSGAFAESPTDFHTEDGIEVSIHVKPAISGGRPVMALRSGAYNALVVPSRLVDVLIDDGISIALANEDGTIIQTLNAPDREAVSSLVAGRSKGMTDSDLFATARREGMVAVATKQRSQVANGLNSERMLMLPIGLVSAIFTVGVVIWLSRRRLSPLAELEIAVRKCEFVVHYQPIIALNSGICVGAEALVRWRRPDGTLIKPDLFIPLAEETGLIMPITDQVIEAVISDMKSTLIDDRSLHIAINLCAADIKSGRILDILETKLRQSGVRPEQIWLEATERGFIDIEAARSTLARARGRGHSVAIDDFGTGYSSLQYLQGLPMDALKIDKSFIDTIGRDTATSSVTPHIIEMAKTLGLFTVAEGIETKEQADHLQALGVDFGQGWFYAKPMPAEDFIVYHRQTQDKYGTAPEIIRVSQ